MHVISGEDYPVKPLKTIYEFYENNDQIYIQCEPAEGSVKSGESQVLWQKYYFDYDKINRRTTFGKIYHRYTLLKQTLLHVDKFKELRYNNPHKMSLYIASGLPIIIWKNAAQAKFVKENGIGICVENLKDIHEAFSAISEHEYKQMLFNVLKVRREVVNGEFTRSAIVASLNI